MLSEIKDKLKKYVKMKKLREGQARNLLKKLHAEMKAERKNFKEFCEQELKRELKKAEPYLVAAVRKGKKVVARYAGMKAAGKVKKKVKKKLKKAKVKSKGKKKGRSR